MDTEFFVDYRYEELMYQMADHLSGTLHELAVTEGIIPSLSSKQAIQVVFDHKIANVPEHRPSPRLRHVLGTTLSTPKQRGLPARGGAKPGSDRD